MKKKILTIMLSSSTFLIVLALVVLIPILMIMDFFGANITDGYIENNKEYAKEYLEVLNKNFRLNNGYVSLERILYFYLADKTRSFEEIFTDNIDKETKKLIPISIVCELNKYRVLEVCKPDNIFTSNQIDLEQAKPFAPPINFSNTRISSFFMEKRTIYGEENIHKAWDISAKEQTPIYSVCDGIVETVSFPYKENTSNTNDKSTGNTIKISCKVNDLKYIVLYGHLYPSSTNLRVGDKVNKGQVIARVGTTGYSTGNHLHYQVTLDGQIIDGMSLIDFNYEIENNSIFNQPSLNNALS